MAEDKATIDVLLRMQDFATKELKKFGKESRRAGTEGSKQLNKVDKSAAKLTKRLVKVVSVVGTVYAAFRAGKAIVGTGFGLVEDAARAEEAISKFNVVFGEEAERTRQLLEGYADAVGRSKTELIEFTSGIQDTLVPMGFAREEAAKLALGFSALAVDVASFSNRLDADVVNDFTSALVGETEPLRKYGVVIMQADIAAEALRLGLVGVNGEIDGMAKTAAVASLIVQGTSDAQGDAARTADSWTNTIKKLNARIGELRVAIGGFVRDELLKAIERFGGVDKVAEGVGIALAVAGQAAVSFTNIVVDGAVAFSKITGAGDKAEGALRRFFEIVRDIEKAIRELLIKAPVFIQKVTIKFNEMEAAINGAFAALLKGLDSIIGVDIDDNLIFGLGIAAFNAEQRVKALKAELSDLEFAEALNLKLLTESFDAAAESTNKIIAAIFGLGKGAPSLDALRGQALAAADGVRTLIDDFIAGTRKNVDDANAKAESLAQTQAKVAEFIKKAFRTVELKVIQARMKGDRYKKSLKEQKESAAAAREEFRQLADEALRIAEAQRKAADSAGAVRDAYDEWIDSLSNANLAGGAARGVFGALESGISDLSRRLVDSEASFRGWARSVVQSIGQVLAEFFLLKALRAALGGLFASSTGDVAEGPLLEGFDFSQGPTTGGPTLAMGGVVPGQMRGSFPVNAYANGGIATTPQIALFGEGRGAEAFVPLPDGRSIPVTMTGDGGGGGANVTINLNAIDSKSGVEFLEANAKAIGDTISSQIEAGANRKLNRAVGRA